MKELPSLPRLADVTAAQIKEQQSLDYCKWLGCLTATNNADKASELYLERFPHSFSASTVRKSLDNHSRERMVTKAAIAPGTSTDATWAAPLVGIQQLEDGFAKVAHSASLLGRIPGLRLVPFNTKIPSESASRQLRVGWREHDEARFQVGLFERLRPERLEKPGHCGGLGRLRALGHARHGARVARHVDPRLDRLCR